MELYAPLFIILSVCLLLSLILSIKAFNKLNPFKKMKKDDYNKCYNLKIFHKNTQKRNK